ncbi:MAG: hypothetical protein PHH54_02060 [Candidatus Nanoarchaeia archaeon]|nr:hypothetical protein [Candidatus Nanoarchaeia archaeon]MDD5740746.1 hypothetical protein [Candidatus Nanoarchaeia archaeon]
MVKKRLRDIERELKRIKKLKNSSDYYYSRAPLYEEAAQSAVSERKVKKAINYFRKAAGFYEELEGSSVAEHGAGYFEKYVNSKNRCLKNAERLKKVSEGKWHGLEGKSFAIIALFSLIFSFLFLLPNLTGNVIANLTTKNSSIIGAGLFVLGIIGSYFYFRKK